MNLEDRKHVLRMLEHGLYIVSAGQGDEAIANAVTWLSQSAIQPPGVMIAIRAQGRLHHAIEQSGAFAVNIVAANQQEMVQTFFRSAQVEETTINGYPFEPGPATSSPLFPACPAWFECRLRESVKGGDHTIFIAEIVDAGVRDPDAQPLTLSATPWSYGV